MFELILIICFLVVMIFLLKIAIQGIFAPPEKLKFALKVFFINGYENYNNIVI